MTTNVSTQTFQGNTAPVDTPLPIPDALREDGPLANKIRSCQPRSDQHELIQLQRTCLGCLEQWRMNWNCDTAHPNAAVRQSLLNILYDYTVDFVPEPLRICVLAIALPNEKWNALDMAARAYDAQRTNYDALLGELVPPIVVERADWLIHSDNYDSTAALDFGRTDDAGVYLKILHYQKSNDSQPTGILTGIAELDRATHGMRGLWLIGGEGGVGKSAIAQSFGLGALMQSDDTALIIHQLDMSKEACFDRLICALGGISEAELRSRDLPADRQIQVDHAIAEFRKLSNRIDVVYHPPGSALDVDALLARRDAFLRVRNCKRAVMVIDYLQLIPVADDIRDPLEADRRRIEVLQRIQRHSRYSGQDALVVISEVRKTDPNSQLVLADLLGASRLGYAADVVLMLQPGKTDALTEGDTVAVDLGVVKVRRGRKTTIRLMFDFLTYRFRAADIPRQDAVQPVRAAGKRRRASKDRDPLN